MREVLASAQKNITEKYESEFAGMTADPVALDVLLAARVNLVEAIVGQMPAPHREFLIGFEGGNPDWELLDLPEAAQLPAVRWRQKNLDGLDAARRAELVARLTAVLSSDRAAKAPDVPHLQLRPIALRFALHFALQIALHFALKRKLASKLIRGFLGSSTELAH